MTGNPNYEGLCKGVNQVYGPDQVQFVGRWNGWDVTDLDSIATYISKFDVFINSQYGANGEQVELLEKVYPQFKGSHIINISSATSYWMRKPDVKEHLPDNFPEWCPENYLENKIALDDKGRELVKNVCWGTSDIKITNIAFGQLASKYQNQNAKNKIGLVQAGQIIKWVIDCPPNINLHYMALDPIQREDLVPDSNQGC